MNINATLISQALIFAVFVYICYRYIWPPILSTMEERENKMAAGLEAAKQAGDSLEEAKLTYEKELKEAKKEAANIVLISPFPSIGFPKASTTRPSISSPTGTSKILPVHVTFCPSLNPR